MNTTTHQREMQAGHDRLSSGSLRSALNHFVSASHNSDSLAEHAEALQMAGVTFRKQCKLLRAAEYGRRALECAQDSGDANAISGAARDLAATLHAEGIYSSEGRAATLREALALYELSLEQDALLRQGSLSGSLLPDDQQNVTRGMKALLLFDMAHYRIWINDDGSEPGRLHWHEARAEQERAVNALHDAHFSLRLSDNRVWELNNLLKYMQVAPLIERIQLKRRANELTVLYPNREKEVWASLAGRRAVRLVLFMKVRRMRN